MIILQLKFLLFLYVQILHILPPQLLNQENGKWQEFPLVVFEEVNLNHIEIYCILWQNDIYLRQILANRLWHKYQ